MPKKDDEDVDIQKLTRKAMRDEASLDELPEGTLGNVFATIDRDIGRFTMSIIMHREVDGPFR